MWLVKQKVLKISRHMTNPTKWHAPSEDSDQPGHLLSAWRNLGTIISHLAHGKDSDQTGKMPRLIWVFTGAQVILLVLSCCGSNALSCPVAVQGHSCCPQHHWAEQSKSYKMKSTQQDYHPARPCTLIRVLAVCMKELWVLTYPQSTSARLCCRCSGRSETSLGTHHVMYR